jgi:hypothetical protein
MGQETAMNIRSHPALAKIERCDRTAAWIFVALVALLWIPIFIRMPPSIDANYFDLAVQARARGTKMYVEFVDGHPPGIHWIHSGIRYCLGWSSEAMRSYDLLNFFLVAGYLSIGLRSLYRSASMPIWTLMVLMCLYLPASEQSQCERDPWLFLFALGAFQVRIWHVPRVVHQRASLGECALGGMLEGLLWMMALLIKPQMIVLPFGLLAASLLIVARSAGWKGSGKILLHAGGALLGGFLLGLVGLHWIAKYGSWEKFYELYTVILPKYSRWHMFSWQKYDLMLAHYTNLLPLSLVHLGAIPLAIRNVLAPLWRRRSDGAGIIKTFHLAALYLIWLVQVNFIQSFADYCLYPPLFLAVAIVLSSIRWNAGLVLIGWLVPAMFLLDPAFVRGSTGFYGMNPRIARMHAWLDCWSSASTPELKDRTRVYNIGKWTDLEKVKQYLVKHRGHGDLGRVNFYSWSGYPLQQELNLPSVSHYYWQSFLMEQFRENPYADYLVPIILQELRTEEHQYIVANVGYYLVMKHFKESDLPPEGEVSDWPVLDHGSFENYPWIYPIVFRAGWFLVLKKQ